MTRPRTPSHPALETRGGKQRHRDTPQLRAVSPIHLPPRSEPGPEVGLGLYADPDADCSHYCQGWSRGQNYTLSATKCTVLYLCPRLISILIWRQVEVKYAQLFTVSKMCIFKHLFQHIRSLLYFLPGCQPMFLLVPSFASSDRIPSIF